MSVAQPLPIIFLFCLQTSAIGFAKITCNCNVPSLRVLISLENFSCPQNLQSFSREQPGFQSTDIDSMKVEIPRSTCRLHSDIFSMPTNLHPFWLKSAAVLISEQKRTSAELKTEVPPRWLSTVHGDVEWKSPTFGGGWVCRPRSLWLAASDREDRKRGSSLQDAWGPAKFADFFLSGA